MKLSRSVSPWLVNPLQIALAAFLLLTGWLSVSTGMRYPGNPLVYVCFAVLANGLLLNGFRRNAIFFDTFIGIFFWLGFYLKLCVNLTFYRGRMGEPTGAFIETAANYDRALTVVCVAFAALLLVSFLRSRVFSYSGPAASCRDQPLYQFYCRHRSVLLLGFVAAMVLVGASNVWLVIYQRGMVTQTVLPLGLNGVYKWLLQFGLASVSALVIRFEVERAGQLNATAIFFPLLESCISNVSLMSRGMVLNVTALGVGTLRTLYALGIRLRTVHFFAAAVGFAALFACSVLVVNYLRTKPIYDPLGDVQHYSDSSVREEEREEKRAQRRMARENETEEERAQRRKVRAEEATRMSHPLFIDRWVGLEGVMAVTSAPDLGWDLWREAWREKYDERTLGLYDRHFIDSPYKLHGNKGGTVHYVSLPGLVAFLFYPGSLGFLFVAMMGFAAGAAALEFLCYRLCGRNLILCSLLAQVIAFRYASFGYVPAQSYLLFGTIVLNVLLIWGVNRVLVRYDPEGAAART